MIILQLFITARILNYKIRILESMRILFLFILIILFSCASQGIPSGGPVDEEGPSIMDGWLDSGQPKPMFLLRILAKVVLIRECISVSHSVKY